MASANGSGRPRPLLRPGIDAAAFPRSPSEPSSPAPDAMAPRSGDRREATTAGNAAGAGAGAAAPPAQGFSIDLQLDAAAPSGPGALESASPFFPASTGSFRFPSPGTEHGSPALASGMQQVRGVAPRRRSPLASPARALSSPDGPDSRSTPLGTL